MHDEIGTVSAENNKRKGLHKIFHTSKFDRYFSAVAAIILLFLAMNKGMAGDWDTGPLSGGDCLQLALLWGIFGLVADIHYRMYEAKYDK
jgi:hypothetical protein